MNKTISALYARTQFGQIMEKASKNKTRFLVGKRGVPKILIMGVEDYIKSFGPVPEVITAIRRDAERNGTSKLTMRQIEKEIAAVRRKRRQSNAT